MKKKIKKLKKEVMHYAKLLGVSHLVGNISIEKELEDERIGEVSLFIYLDKCDMAFTTIEKHIIIHELLHLAFKNTYNFMENVGNKHLQSVFHMIHEQEIDKLAIALVKTLPEYREG